MAGRWDAELGERDYQAHASFRHELRRFLHSSDENAQAAGVTAQQHLALLAIRGHPAYPAVSIADVAEQLMIRHHSASLLVERMVQRDLLQRRPDSADQRRVFVSLTAEGQRILAHITDQNRRDLRALEHALGLVQASLKRLSSG
jgi:DNA-binding MarR family transcriptional regulator